MGDKCGTEKEREREGPGKTEMEDHSSIWQTNVVIGRGFAPDIRFSDLQL